MSHLRRTVLRLVPCLVILVGLGLRGDLITGAAAQEAAQVEAPPALPACADLDALGIPMQMNLRASAAMVACGREAPGKADEASGGGTRTSLVGGNVDVIRGGAADTYPHVTQSEHQIWVNGTTVVVNYNDSRTAPSNYSGVSYSTNGGAIYTRILPSPFATGHGTNYGDPNVVFNKNLNTWFAGDLATGCGGQGIGLWTSPDGITWSAGVCAHSGTDDDRNSMWVDNNAASAFYGRMYISFNDFSTTNANLVVTHSDNGTTWSAPTTVYSADFRRDVQINVAANGTVLLAGMNEGTGGSSNRQNTMYRSTDGGVTFGSEITLGAPFAPVGDFNSGYFRIVNPIWRHMGWGDLATGANNVVIYSYAANGGGGGDTGDIYIVRSTDNGLTWSAPVRMDGTGLNNEQWMPSTAGGGGNFLVSWYDRKNMGGGGAGGSLLPNGGFETGDFTSWTIQDTTPTPTVSSADKHSGTYSAHLGTVSGAEPLGNSSIYQTFVVPGSPGWLTYWWKGTTADSIYFDWQDAYLTDASGTILATIMHVCETTGGWVQAGINMAPYAGQTVRIKFLVHQDGFGDDTDMYVDDVTIGAAALSNDYERWGRVSRNGGATWLPPQRISDMIIPQPAQPDPSVQALYAGDYMRSFFDGKIFYDGWTDGRVAVNATNQQDVETQRFSASPATFDFDSDARTDRTVFRPSSGVWYSALSGGGATATHWGASTDIDVAGDYDGDGKVDIAVFRPSTGTWYIIQSSRGDVRVDNWGTSGDIPMAGDVDGDGKADLVIWRPSTGVWYVKKSSGGVTASTWGTSGDIPLLADYDGDGKADLIIFRPSTGVWYGLFSSGGTDSLAWGASGDIPVIGDFDGDGIADPTVFRPSTGTWFVWKTSGGYISTVWGASGDIPVTGDWDGDGLSDFTVWRDSTGVWYTKYAAGGVVGVGFGTSGDKPVGRRPGS